MWMKSQAIQATKTPEPKPSDFRDCCATADRRQRALVDVTKRLRRLAPNRMRHIVRCVPSFLHSGWSQAGNRFAIRLENRGQVPNHEHVRRAGHRKVGVDDHAAGAVERNLERLAERRRCSTNPRTA